MSDSAIILNSAAITRILTRIAHEIAERNETGSEVALVDLNPHLGDIAVLLGIAPSFTIADAFNNPGRLDEDFVSSLVTRHRTGLSVIAAPDAYNASAPMESKSIGKLVDLAANQFPYVVIDAGAGLGQGAAPVFQLASMIYLVTQVDIPSLRNSQRFLAYLRGQGEHHVELVVNRWRKAEFDDESPYKVIYKLRDLIGVDALGGTMRLGKYPCALREGSISRAAYGTELVEERHRHRYEVNPEYVPTLEERGFRVTGASPDGKFVEMIELEGHPWFVGCQFHPEYKSRPAAPHPLFRSFIAAARAFKSSNKTTMLMQTPTEAEMV